MVSVVSEGGDGTLPLGCSQAEPVGRAGWSVEVAVRAGMFDELVADCSWSGGGLASLNDATGLYLRRDRDCRLPNAPGGRMSHADSSGVGLERAASPENALLPQGRSAADALARRSDSAASVCAPWWRSPSKTRRCFDACRRMLSPSVESCDMIRFGL